MIKTTVSLALLALFIVAGCGGGSSSPRRFVPPPAEDIPTFSTDRFAADSAMIDHELLPFLPGRYYLYEGEDETIEIFVSHLTKTVLGIECAIVVDRAYEDGELVEETFDWYAKDVEGFVWYMGEDSTEFEDGAPVSKHGSWEAGKDVAGIGNLAVAGILMLADPAPVGSYYQEFYEGEAEDEAEVVELSVPLTLGDGSSHTCLKTREWTELEPGVTEFKYYSPGIGLVREETADLSEEIELAEAWVDTAPPIDPDDFPEPTVIDNPWLPMIPGVKHTFEVETEDGKETIVVEVLPETRLVMGILCRVVRDRVWLEGLLIEDTHDWYAQDGEGNVWYMGEEVDNYEYDDDGTFLALDHEGAWEAGVDSAVPGIIMKADPRVGDCYRQEYLEGEAEDMGAVLSLADAVVLPDASIHICLKTRDWTPLEPDAVEFKWYAQGIGVVREQTEDGEETMNLVKIE